MSGLLLDIRVAFRSLRKAGTMTVVALSCLALGIGANVAVFSVVRAVLLQELPFPNADRLVTLWVNYGNYSAQTRFFMSPQQFMEIRDRNAVLDRVAASRVETLSLDEGEYPTEVTGARVTSSLFDLAGVVPIVGRTFSDEEETVGALVAVISDGLWARSFGRRRGIVGVPLRLEGRSYQIVGVVPGTARVPPDVDVWVPLNPDGARGRDLVAGSLTAIGLLASETNLESAQQHLSGIASDIAEALPERNTHLDIGLARWQETLVEGVRPALIVLMVAVMGVLALAVSNVVSLLLVRARREQHHHALRSALGATSARLLRYLVIENGLLTGCGCLLGTGAAYVMLPALLALQPNELSPFRSVGLDSAVLMFAVGLTIAITAVTTVFTIWHTRFSSLVRRLVDGAAGGGVSRNTLRVQRVLVVSQIAASVILVVGSSLLIRSFLMLQRVDPGFVADNVIAIRLGFPPGRAATHEQRVTYLGEVLSAIRNTRGVLAAGAAHVLPVTDGRWGLGFNVEGQMPETPTERQVAVWRLITPGYYEAMGIRIIRGRSFAESDRFTTEPVAVVSESLANQYWPGDNPIGRRVKRGTYDDPTEPWRTVIGVSNDVSDSALAGRPRASLHFPYQQFETTTGSRMTAVVKVQGNSPDHVNALLQVVRGIDRAALIPEIAPYADLLGETVTQERFNTLLMSIFAAVGLLLAAVGIYGVVSYSAAQRRVEFGIRMALGAQGGDVRGLMLRAGAMMAAVGVSIGVLIAYGVSPVVESILRTGESRAPMPYLLAALVLMTTTVLAAWLPARRITRMDLSNTLRK